LLFSRIRRVLGVGRHPYPPVERPAAGVLDTCHLPAVPRLCVAAYCQGSAHPYPYQLSLVLVAAQCRLVL
jgi:hypothetical protein